MENYNLYEFGLIRNVEKLFSFVLIIESNIKAKPKRFQQQQTQQSFIIVSIEAPCKLPFLLSYCLRDTENKHFY